jgi:hypothetical protein
MNLLYGILWGILGQIGVFLQLQGTMKFDVLKNNTWLVLLMGLPISWFFLNSVRNLVIWGDGQLWPSRIIGFSIGIVVFGVMSSLVFGEGLNTKTAICVVLSMLVVLIQVFWK